MKISTVLILATLALGSLVTITVLAQNPHFMSCTSNGVDNSGSTSGCFDIAGLGAGASSTITATAQATAVYGCLNRGGQCPNSKVESTGTVSGSQTVKAGRNGRATGCIPLSPPPPPSSLNCPNGQKLVLV